MKRPLQKLLHSQFNPLIIASMGRSGSTLIFSSVSDGIAEARFGVLSRFGKKIVRETAWDLGSRTFHKGVVYKTHGLANELPSNTKAKVVFVYDAASDAALSVLSCRRRYGEKWIERHLDHLRAIGDLDEITTRDILRFEEQINGWGNRSDIPRLMLKYNSIWKYRRELALFCGCDINLPARKKRKSLLGQDPITIKKIREVYSELDDKIAQMEECKLLDVGQTL